MTGMLVIVCIFLYLSIGSIIAGILREKDFEAFALTLSWPIILTGWIFLQILKLPYKFGSWLRCKYLRRKH